MAEFYSQDFEIKNSTGVDIHELYISPTESEDWEEDVLGDDVFAADDTWEVTFDVVTTDGYTWDIKVVDEDEDEYIFEELALSGISKIELAFKNGTDPYAILK
ncbi:hypothetical protein LJB76_02660 [Clostridia bacterium OttesenSCG-928-O13]|nr:hypothetical protein [Clostridia bacterium OttesenSCG-928-O13]